MVLLILAVSFMGPKLSLNNSLMYSNLHTQSERGGVAQFFRSCCDEVVLYGDVLDEEALLKIVAMILRE